MELTSTVKQFIQEHLNDDPAKLLLSASRYPEIDMPFVIEQITSRKQIKDKLPSWYNNPDILFPAKIAAEQCSSEQTAYYKQRLINSSTHLCDLTGGLGIDSYFFSQKAKQVTYIERFPYYCEIAQHNFQVLKGDTILVKQGNSIELLNGLEDVDVFYIDPARRGEGDKRVYALSDCEPDLTEILPRLFEKAPQVIAKLSPMVDIQQTLDLLPHTTAIHILSVKNECKELLFVLECSGQEQSIPIVCVNFTPVGKEESFVFSLQEEKQTEILFADKIKTFLYEPNSSVMKGGAFRSICRLGVEKLQVSSHLYTSEEKVVDFLGRIFVVEEVYAFNNKLLKTIAKDYPKANITVRNFPLSVAEIRMRTKIKEGGAVYFFATTLANEEKVMIRCRKEE